MPLSKKEELLLEDYKISLDLLKHEDGRKASLLTLFFLIQGGLFTFYGWIAPTNKSIAVMLTVLAMFFCVFWYLVMNRLHAFIRLRVYQLQQIEKALGVITTVTNEEMLRRTGKTEVFGHIYKLSIQQKLFSVSKVETVLPAIVGVFWLLIAAGAIFGFI